jgi:hypothetical protein
MLGDGARTAVIEYRYTDVDYQSEHGRFYSQTFRHYPSTVHRLHFFREDPPNAVYSTTVAAVFDEMEYMGYAVLRPVNGAVVGRTMLAVPAELRRIVTCLAEDRINFFGTDHTVVGAPFVGQDGQFGSCAHAAAWTVAYLHARRYGASRYVPSQLADAVPSALTDGRTLPTPGLVVAQLSDVLEAIGVPPIVYWLQDMPFTETDKVARRYLDSGLPLIVGTRTHAFTLIGYRASSRGPATFVCQDDEVGPYRMLTRPSFNLSPEAWQYLIAPLPDQIYLPCSHAEQIGTVRLENDLRNTANNGKSPAAAESAEMLRRLKTRRRGRGQYGFVTSAIRSNEFKASLQARGYVDRVARSYMRIPMWKWIWVVELVDLKAFREGEPSVMAEAVIDPTEHIRDSHVLAWRVPGLLRHWNNDTDQIGDRAVDPSMPRTYSACATSRERKMSLR